VPIYRFCRPELAGYIAKVVGSAAVRNCISSAAGAAANFAALLLLPSLTP
jgi:hypothetical protein